MNQPSIQLAGIQIDEPVTTLTVLIVSFVCFYAYIKLRFIPVQNRVHFFLRYYFLSMGIATAIGGIIGHAFLYALAIEWKLAGWITSMFSIMLVERAAIEYALPLIHDRMGKILKWVNLIELLTFITLTCFRLDFFFVEVHSSYGLLVVVASLNFYVFMKLKTTGSKLFLIAVGFSAIAALIFMNKWSLSVWFNYKDISHVLMSISALFFYFGARRIIIDPFPELQTDNYINK
jgi:hypothetical protein